MRLISIHPANRKSAIVAILSLLVSVATLIFNARHQIHAYGKPAAAERAMERA